MTCTNVCTRKQHEQQKSVHQHENYNFSETSPYFFLTCVAKNFTTNNLKETKTTKWFVFTNIYSITLNLGNLFTRRSKEKYVICSRIKHEFPYFGDQSLSTNCKRVILSRLKLSPTKLMKHYHSFCDDVLKYYKVDQIYKDIIYIPTLIKYSYIQSWNDLGDCSTM
jgi:hypothetical protein